MSTIIISAFVGTALFFAGRKLYKDKKAGKSVCGGNCSCCPNSCACHKENKPNE